MSLEAALIENTAALNALTAALTQDRAALPQGFNASTVTRSDTGNSLDGAVNAAAQQKVAAKAPAPKAKPAAAPVAEAVPYAEVSQATLELVKTRGRDVAVKLLGKYKVAAATELATKQYASYLAEARALLGLAEEAEGEPEADLV